ncbi:family 78 glycoside hydrolase catalytic domain [Actinophytocola sp.]|uniref:family 78 glycoside hydrolase catalytic domain n=1 Tax=Actinophytocola sp. TaxID=1872138 RepID=UPI002D27C7F1|nr:family 78 glycoside hydrolase catalytic domain [Actinophytocola sp.]HYQ67743.1 family 78 glycoside hydrolase catalytic domain [Actinophytocola sp.]
MRLALVLVLFLASLVCVNVPSGAAATGLAVHDLRTGGRASPLGVDDPRPTFGWRLRSGVRGDRQTAYRIVVDSGKRVWDSGKVTSEYSVAVPYGGPALLPAHRYRWTVRVWDAHGRPSAPSAPAWWETGLLGTDWPGARWITPAAADAYSWQDFTLDTDFVVRAAAASVVFRAKDTDDFYLWQINSVTTPGKVLLRPHVRNHGSYALLGEVDLAPVLTPANVTAPHHLRIEARGSTLTTWVDGTRVDTRTDGTLTAGTIGFRTSVSNGVREDARYDNLAVRGLDGQVLFADDFSVAPDPRFPGEPVTDGQLAPGGDPTLVSQDTAPLLRHEFVLDKPVASARADVYGLGFVEPRLNGRKVGENVLTPASTPYERRNLYDTYDVTGQLRQGANAVGLWLGNGYGPRFSPFGFRWTGPKQAILLLTVTFTDGTRQTVGTDESWRWSTGPITADDLYAGESYDARLARHGWDEPGFDDSAWHPVRTAAAPSPVLTANDAPPIRVVETLRARALTQPRPGVYVYDFGQNIAGWERLRVGGPAGTTVRMRTAEELAADGTLDTTTNRAAASTDTYTLAGTGTETYEPRFTYHGFRYLEVTGYPGTPTLDSVAGRVVHADVAAIGTIETSDPLLNRIWRNNRWAVLNNSMSLPTDNPVRDERTPPGMDVQAYHEASVRDFGMDRFYGKYLLDLPPGTALPNDAGNAQQPDMGGGSVTLAWTLYEQYGDLPALARSYPAMKAFVDANARTGLVWPDRGFGDWCPPDRGPNAGDGQGNPNAGACFSERSLVNTALSYRQATSVARAAAALGLADDATHFTDLAAAIANAFNTRFLAGTTYGDGRQVTSVLPLAFGMVPADKVAGVGAQLVDTILNKDGGHLDTGIFGTRYLVDALARVDRLDVAMTVLDQTTYPGFGYEISRGATTPWEQWTYESNMETHDHAMFAGVNASLYTQLGGITPASPGYASIAVAPRVPAGLARFAASLDTVRGTVRSAWTNGPCGLDLSVTVPVNATATVTVPLAGGHPVRATSGAVPLSRAGQYSVGSGTWRFTVARCP